MIWHASGTIVSHMNLKVIFFSLLLLQGIILNSQTRSGLSFGTSLFTPREIVLALQKAYPDAIDKIEIRDGDTAFRINDQWMYWAEGRLLSTALRYKSGDYSPWPFYPYSKLYNPPIQEFSPDEKVILNKRLEERERQPISRNTEFYSQLYRITDEDSAWQMMKTTYFLGYKVMIHRDLLEDLARVEEALIHKMKSDAELSNYIDSIKILAGFNYRIIDGTDTLSNHSFGIALDVIPKDYAGKHAYWRWFMDEYTEWYSLPWDRRYIPPESFVKAFEKEGFIWGGKWFFFDGIHFEYRPEILILNGLR